MASAITPVSQAATALKEIELRDAAKFVNGFAFKTDTWSDAGRPIIRIQNLTGSNADYNYFQGQVDPRYLVRAGDILVSWSASLDVFLWEGPEAWLNQHIFKVTEIAPRVDAKYLYFALKARIADIRTKTQGSTMKHVTRGDFLAAKIPLPDLDEQRAIAAALTAIQRAIRATDEVIASARRIKASLASHLFTYGPVPVAQAAHVALKETEIGRMPDSWSVVDLAAIVEKAQQIDPVSREFLKYVDVSSVSRASLAIESWTQYHGKDAPGRARKLVQTDDVIFATVRPSLRRVASVPPELDGEIVSTAFCVIRAAPARAIGRFLFYAVSRDCFVERVAARQHGSSYPAVTDKQVLAEALSLPSLAEQRQIADCLDATDRKIRAEEARRRALRVVFDAAMSEIMTGRRRLSEAIA